MEDKIIEIISAFTKIPIEQIRSSTIIDRSVLSSSIMLHRMYAKLAEQGFIVKDYSEVKDVGSLLKSISGSSNTYDESLSSVRAATMFHSKSIGQDLVNIGIDIEEIDAMPRTNDFREEAFYKMNFSASEIAYCILQPDPYASFAGLFAAKEAIVKADNYYSNRTFNNIVIEHSMEGKPQHSECHLSISHTKNNAVAVAIQLQKVVMQGVTDFSKEVQGAGQKNYSILFFFVLISLTLSAIAIIAVFRH